jgi:hypothetical protein
MWPTSCAFSFLLHRRTTISFFHPVMHVCVFSVCCTVHPERPPSRHCFTVRVSLRTIWESENRIYVHVIYTSIFKVFAVMTTWTCVKIPRKLDCCLSHRTLWCGGFQVGSRFSVLRNQTQATSCKQIMKSAMPGVSGRHPSMSRTPHVFKEPWNQ